MKCVIFLALVVLAAAQQHRPDHDHNNPLHNMVHAEVWMIMAATAGITVDDCSMKCDALFVLSAGHDEQTTDHLCHAECVHQHTQHHGHVQPTGAQ